ncbi:MAG: hypothetical protein KME31_23660 [Tolypothrix carrinoi HA7290-LM1]|nr:hypothetical protein [Tolypothrix carrinoi HA7290-LM1]
MVSPALREGFPPQATGEPEGVMGNKNNYQCPITFFPITNYLCPITN